MRRWFKEEEEVLRKCSEKGLSIKDVSRILQDRSIDSIANKANSLGICFPGKSPTINYSAYQELTGEALEI